jgi:hypothetical protein
MNFTGSSGSKVILTPTKAMQVATKGKHSYHIKLMHLDSLARLHSWSGIMQRKCIKIT